MAELNDYEHIVEILTTVNANDLTKEQLEIYMKGMLEVVKKNGLDIQQFHWEVTKNEDFMYDTGSALLTSICEEAVKQNGFALQYVKYPYDRDVRLLAVQQNCSALQFVAGDDYYEDKYYHEVCMTAINKDPFMLQYVDGYAFSDKKLYCDICTKAMKKNPLAAQYVEDGICSEPCKLYHKSVDWRAGVKEKKYELIGEGFYVNNSKLRCRQIKALRDFGNIKAGDLGGYIETEENLSHQGNCWVHKDSYVLGNASVRDNACVGPFVFVSDNAQVFDNASVGGYPYDSGSVSIYGNAKVYGNAHAFTCVFDDAEVYEDAEVYCDEGGISGNAKIHGKAKLNGNISVDGNVEIAGNVELSNCGHITGDKKITKMKQAKSAEPDQDSMEQMKLFEQTND